MHRRAKRRDSCHRKEVQEERFKVPFGTGEFDETMARPLLGTLPSAFVSGTNLINLFNSLCVGYQDSMDFSQCL